jgi:predicted protein tyrosine phosphatase
MIFERPIIQNELFEGIMGINEYKEYQTKLSLEYRKDIVLISITEPESSVTYPDTKLSEDSPIYTLGYHDVIEMKFWDVEKPIGTNYLPLSDEQGKELRTFIEKNKDKKFLIHCKAGESRSAGIGLAVECIVNFNGNRYEFRTGKTDIYNYTRYSPNLTVFDKIIGDGE